MSPQPQVGIVMGSDSDWRVMQGAADVLGEFDLTLGLTGHTAVGQLTREVLRRV